MWKNDVVLYVSNADVYILMFFFQIITLKMFNYTHLLFDESVLAIRDTWTAIDVGQDIPRSFGYYIYDIFF